VTWLYSSLTVDTDRQTYTDTDRDTRQTHRDKVYVTKSRIDALKT